jgi:hypothetical protein
MRQEITFRVARLITRLIALPQAAVAFFGITADRTDITADTTEFTVDNLSTL